MWIIRTFPVSVHRPYRPDQFTPLSFFCKRSAYFFRHIPAVHLIEHIFQRDNIAVVRALCMQRVKIICQRHEAHAHEREYPFYIISCLPVIPSETRQVLDNDTVCFPVFDILHQAVKARP